jgi:hypothetical protein
MEVSLGVKFHPLLIFQSRKNSLPFVPRQITPNTDTHSLKHQGAALLGKKKGPSVKA